MHMNQILLICVNYKNYNETIKFVKSIYTLPESFNVRTIIVDNDGINEDNPFKEIKEKYGYLVDYYVTNENLGYFGGANYGLRKKMSELESYKFVIISNTDIEFIEKDIFVSLLNLNLQDTIIAPNIILKDSLISQNPFLLQKPSKFKMRIRKFFFSCIFMYNFYTILHYYKKTLKFRKKEKPIKENGKYIERLIYAPHGAFIIFPKSYFNKTAGFYHEPFLFNEEITVAEEARRENIKVLYYPQIKVLHNEHSTIGKVPSSIIGKYAIESFNIIYKKYYKGGKHD